MQSKPSYSDKNYWNNFGKVTGCKRKKHQERFFLLTVALSYGNRAFSSLEMAAKSIKHLGINLTRKAQHSFGKNCKMLLKM